MTKLMKQRKIDDCVITSLCNLNLGNPSFAYDNLLESFGVSKSLFEASQLLNENIIINTHKITKKGFQEYKNRGIIDNNFDYDNIDDDMKFVSENELFDIKEIFATKKGLISTELKGSKLNSLHCISFEDNKAYCPFNDKFYNFDEIDIFEILYII